MDTKPEFFNSTSSDLTTQVLIDGSQVLVENLGMSSVDVTVYAVGLPGNYSSFSQLGTLSQLAISTHRDKFPIDVMGHIGRKGFTAGPRVVAGTLVFSTLYDSAFGDIVYEYSPSLKYAIPPDSYPPFDIHITKVNETGQVTFAALRGVTILDYGTNESTDNIVPMESYSFMALDFQRFRRIYAGGQKRDLPDSAMALGGALAVSAATAMVTSITTPYISTAKREVVR